MLVLGNFLSIFLFLLQFLFTNIRKYFSGYYCRSNCTSKLGHFHSRLNCLLFSCAYGPMTTRNCTEENGKQKIQVHCHRSHLYNSVMNRFLKQHVCNLPCHLFIFFVVFLSVILVRKSIKYLSNCSLQTVLPLSLIHI